MSTSLLKVISEKVAGGIFNNLITFIALETKQKWDKTYFQKEREPKDLNHIIFSEYCVTLSNESEAHLKFWVI